MTANGLALIQRAPSGMSFASKGSMLLLVIIAIMASLTGLLGMVVYSLWKAPLGYEDQTGFHVVQQIRSFGIIRRRQPDTAATASLKKARAHS